MSKVTLVEQASAPDTPGAGRASIFINADKNLAWRDDTGAIQVAAFGYDEGTWTPVLTASSSNPTVTYTNQTGRWTRIGNILFFRMILSTTNISGGSGDARFSLPFTVAANGNLNMPLSANNITFSGSPLHAVFSGVESTAFGRILKVASAGSTTVVPLSDLASNITLVTGGFYFV